MVLIEQDNTDDQNANPSNATAGNDASDGFETASEADLDSDGDDDRASSREELQHSDQPQNPPTRTEGEQEQEVPQQSISSEEALINEDELRQVRFQNLGSRKLIWCFSPIFPS